MKLIKYIVLCLLAILLTGCFSETSDEPMQTPSSDRTDAVSSDTVLSTSQSLPSTEQTSPQGTEAPPVTEQTVTTAEPAVPPPTTSSDPASLEAILHMKGDMGYIDYRIEEFGFKLSCPQAFIYDMNEGVILYARGFDQIVYPASTTKLLTILYALTVLPPDELVTPGDELKLVASDSSVAYVKSYHTLTVEMLIEGMLLPSGNDAAYVLAAAAGRKLADDPDLDGEAAVRIFVDGMNVFARQIGCVGTSFTCPDGYYDDRHYTTLEDLILISRLAAENEIIRKYAALPSAKVRYASGHTNTWTNTNLMLDENSEYYSPYVTGLKTGSAHGLNHFICTAEKDGQRYLIGVFGGTTKTVRFADTLKILNELFGEENA
ncbi:MAG: D-alanyl-D-alanine carboxypeptidase family protein [Eubacteriales bacterium]